MSAEKMTSRIENIEAEAEKILEAARKKSDQILVKANEEASRILAAGPAQDEVKAECQKLIQQAKDEAEQKVADARKKAASIKAQTGKKVDEITRRIVNNITGAKLR